MIDLDTILAQNISDSKKELSSEHGLLYDVEEWSTLFIKHLENTKTSKHTLRSYKFILKTLKEFLTNLLNQKKSTHTFDTLDAKLFNEYLTFIEMYKINSEYGNLEQRLKILFTCKEAIFSSHSLEEFYALSSTQSSKISLEQMDTFEYMLTSFGKFIEKNPTPFSKIDNNYLKKYIDNLDKLSNKTMQQRKASLQSFLSFIDKTLNSEHFSSMYWELKEYPLAKENSKVKKMAFDEKLLSDLLFILHNYPKEIDGYLIRSMSNSQYSAYKNSLLILIMMYGGCRASEVVNICFDDIEHIENNSIGIYEITVLGKGNKKRVVYIKEDIIALHVEYLHKHRGKNSFISGKKESTSPLSTQMLYEFSRKIFSLIGSDKKGLHIFRHHFASNFAEKNGNIKLLQELLDHSSITTTMIYSDVREQVKKDALIQLSSGV